MGRFLAESLKQALSPEWRVPAIVLALLLTLTNMVIISHLPEPEGQPSAAFLLAAALRVIGVIVINVIMLRRATGSPRPAMMPDAAFWFYILLVVIGFAIVSLLRQILPGDPTTPAMLVIGSALAGVATAPLAPWMTAAATEKPLAANPRPWFRDMAAWLPALILWQLLLITPLAALHGYIDLGLVDGSIARSIWLETADGLLGTVIALIALGLAVTAYRRVAADSAR